MHKLVDVKILRIFIGELAKNNDTPLYQAIVDVAIKKGMAGAVVTRGVMGFGANNFLHTSKILRLSEDLPMIVQLVDMPKRIDEFLSDIDGLVEEGTIVVENAQAIFHMPLRIRDVMTHGVAKVGLDASLSKIATLLIKHQAKALPVVEDGRLKGIITGGDLLQRAHMPLRLDIQCQLPSDILEGHIRCLDDEGLTAKDVMTKQVFVLNIKTNLNDALVMMAKRKVKRLPVVDDYGNVMGIVSRADILRAIAQVTSIVEYLPELPLGLKRVAADVMFQNVPTVSPETPIPEVLKTIVSSPFRRVVVIDKKNKVIGIILDKDLVDRYINQDNKGLLHFLLNILSNKQQDMTGLGGTAQEIMERNVFSVQPDTSLTDVIKHFVETKSKRLVVTDSDAHLLGMVDRDRVIKALAEV